MLPRLYAWFIGWSSRVFFPTTIQPSCAFCLVIGQSERSPWPPTNAFQFFSALPGCPRPLMQYSLGFIVFSLLLTLPTIRWAMLHLTSPIVFTRIRCVCFFWQNIIVRSTKPRSTAERFPALPWQQPQVPTDSTLLKWTPGPKHLSKKWASH